ncbi:MAG: alternative ribosome rescue aminoacyl-tRNA hydrolase ArfB [Bacteroidota bacterium]
MDREQLVQELSFKAVRSSGAGGQHVNKVSTKIELVFDLNRSRAVSGKEKERLKDKLGKRLTRNGLLLLQVDTTRSQFKNKEIAIKRFLEIVTESLKVHKKRKSTKPTKASVERRLQAKKIAAQKKSGRTKPDLE